MTMTNKKHAHVHGNAYVHGTMYANCKKKNNNLLACGGNKMAQTLNLSMKFCNHYFTFMRAYDVYVKEFKKNLYI